MLVLRGEAGIGKTALLEYLLRSASGYRTARSAGIESEMERARRELLATGETARKRMVETPDELTVQETQIARLARDGLSNHEIGTRLFISPRTVEWHLARCSPGSASARANSYATPA